MQNFKASYINELFKLSKKKKIVVAALFSIAVIFIGAVISCTVNNFMGINFTGKYEFSITVLPVIVNIIIPLFTAFLCIDMFCGEYSDNTIKTTLLLPASRWKIFLSKVCAALTFILFMLLFCMVVSFITGIIIKRTEFNILKIIMAYLLSAFPLCVVCLMSVLVANIAKGSGSSFMLCIVLFLLFKALEVFYPAFDSFFFTSGLNIYVLLNAPLISLSKILRVLLVMIGYIIMFLSLGYFLFDKKEI